MRPAYDNNRVSLHGILGTCPRFSHEAHGERYFRAYVEIPRLSGVADRLPVTVPERLMPLTAMPVGMPVAVEGQLRSFNQMEGGTMHLVLSVFARSLDTCAVLREGSNDVRLRAFLCRRPVYRTTPFMREITDLLLAVNRPYGRSDYIPAIAWGRHARMARTLEVGDALEVTGRFQSREYKKQMPDGASLVKTAYELSIRSVEKLPSSDEQIDPRQTKKGCFEGGGVR